MRVKPKEAPVKSISVRRVYEPLAHDGHEVLVDRVWPRGKSKADLADVRWLKEVAPTTELRKWFGHEPERWPEFRRRYFAELDANPAAESLRALAEHEPLTLLYSAHDEAHNQAVALRDYLEGARA
jgi:uncharacterized protein YeaO (DUF488 family)